MTIIFRGRDNVVGLELCFRKNEAVAFVMPYFQHDSFSVSSDLLYFAVVCTMH